MTVKFYLKTPNASRDSVILACLNYNMVCYKYYLLEKIKPANWNFKTQRVKKSAKEIGASAFNQRLGDVSGKIIESFYKYQNIHCGQPPSPESFRNLLDKVFDKKSSIRTVENKKRTFWGFFEGLLIRMESGSRLHTQKKTPLLERHSAICVIFSIIFAHSKF